MFVFYLLLSLLDLRMLLELFLLGHVSFVWLFAGYFWDLCVTLAFCTWACQLCVYLCILDFALDSLY